MSPAKHDEGAHVIGSTWSGTHDFRAKALVSARSVEEVQDAVRDSDGPVRALGTRHSFTDLADSAGTLVTVLEIPAAPVLDESSRTVTIGSGTRYGIAARWLQERGWALHNLGSLPHISIGGATATATHGSGDRNGNLTTAVRAIEYVDAAGEVRVTRRGDRDFAALAVGLGAFGVAVRTTVAVEPGYRMRQDVYRGLRFDDLLANLDEVTGAAYSVSVFTDWSDTVRQLWLKTRLADDRTEMPDRFFGAERATDVSRIIEGSEDNLTEQRGIPGPWSERLPHFRLDSTPSAGDEIQSEYFVDRSVARGALSAVRALAERIRPLLLISELRTVAADDLWLSTAHQRDALALHFTWKKDPAAVAEVLGEIEHALRDFDARPHWGKLHGFDGDRLARVTPRLADARAVFDRIDPAGRFANEHLRRLGVRS